VRQARDAQIYGAGLALVEVPDLQTFTRGVRPQKDSLRLRSKPQLDQWTYERDTVAPVDQDQIRPNEMGADADRLVPGDERGELGRFRVVFVLVRSSPSGYSGSVTYGSSPRTLPQR
jgi:hypothetical protein